LGKALGKALGKGLARGLEMEEDPRQKDPRIQVIHF